MHGRPCVTKAFCMASQRIFREVNVPTFAVITRNDSENIQLCKEYGIEYVEFRNDPLGAKWNVALSETTGYSHRIIFGSDDIASTSYIKHLLYYANHYDMICTNELYFWGMNPNRDGLGNFIKWQSKATQYLGVGRMVSSKLVEACDNKLWYDNLNSGLDRSALDTVRGLTNNYTYFPLGEDKFIVDIKHTTNVSSMAPQLRIGKKMDAEETIRKFLPEDEVEYLLHLNEKILH